MDTARELVMLVKSSHKQKTIVGDITENIEKESCNEGRIGVTKNGGVTCVT